MDLIGKSDLTRGSVSRHLFRLTVPMIWGFVSMSAFNLTDTFFVSMLGTDALAAISFTFPVVAVVFAVARGLAIGASSAIARAVGSGDLYKVKRLATDGIILNIIFVCIFGLIGILTINPLFRALGATEALLPGIRQYMITWYAGVAFLFIPMMSNHIMRSLGDTYTSSMMMFIAVIFNLILDPIMIFGWGFFPALGITGAALATVISRMLTLIGSLALLHYKYQVLEFNRPSAVDLIASWKGVLHVALPAIGTNLLTPVANGFVTAMAAVYGPTAVAAVGTSVRIQMFAYAVPMSLCMVLMPMVGQNYGSGKIVRVFEAWKKSAVFAIGFGLFSLLLFLPGAGFVARWFSSDTTVIKLLTLNLQIMMLFSAGDYISQYSNMTFNAVGKPFTGSLISLVRLFLLLIPLTWLGSKVYGINGIFWGSGIANIAAGGIAAWIIYRHFKPLQRHDSTV